MRRSTGIRMRGKKWRFVKVAAHAVTHWEIVESFNGPDGKPVASLLACQLETGRTHQIRVHLAHIGHPLMGDAVYGPHFKTKAAASARKARRPWPPSIAKRYTHTSWPWSTPEPGRFWSGSRICRPISGLLRQTLTSGAMTQAG